MDNLFFLQLATSFVIGGAFVALLSFFAERASEKIAGVIISFPSTIVMSYFFIGWALSPNEIAQIVPLAPATLGAVMIFTVTYLYLSKIKIKKVASILISTIGSLTVWLVFAVPLAIYEFSHLPISLIIYVLCALFAYIFLTVIPKEKPHYTILKYSNWQKVGRAVFAGTVIALAVFLSKVLSPFWGGVFSLFPAAYLSSLIILHHHYDSKFLFKVWKNSPMGSIIFVMYPLTAMYTFPAFGIWIGTVLSYAVSLILFLVLREIQK